MVVSGILFIPTFPAVAPYIAIMTQFSGISFADATEVMNLVGAGSVTLFAIWEEAIYPLNFVLNGGVSNETLPAAYKYGNTLNLPTNITKTNRIFVGWYDSAGLSGSPVSQIISTDMGSKTFYAKYDNVNLLISGVELSEYFDNNTTGFLFGKGSR